MSLGFFQDKSADRLKSILADTVVPSFVPSDKVGKVGVAVFIYVICIVFHALVYTTCSFYCYLQLLTFCVLLGELLILSYDLVFLLPGLVFTLPVLQIVVVAKILQFYHQCCLSHSAFIVFCLSCQYSVSLCKTLYLGCFSRLS